MADISNEVASLINELRAVQPGDWKSLDRICRDTGDVHARVAMNSHEGAEALRTACEYLERAKTGIRYPKANETNINKAIAALEASGYAAAQSGAPATHAPL